jgi:hypothetical protein
MLLEVQREIRSAGEFLDRLLPFPLEDTEVATLEPRRWLVPRPHKSVDLDQIHRQAAGQPLLAREAGRLEYAPVLEVSNHPSEVPGLR